MGARGRSPSILRQAMKDLLAQHKTTGIEFSDIERRFGTVERRRLLKMLNNMSDCAEAYCKRSDRGHAGVWFPAAADPDKVPETISPADWRRIQRARMADQADPIVFYGAGLKGGRCSSVWEYARRMQAATGART